MALTLTVKKALGRGSNPKVSIPKIKLLTKRATHRNTGKPEQQPQGREQIVTPPG